MALKSTVLFGVPQSEIAGLLNERISNAAKVNIVSGFVTVEGVKVFENALRKNPGSLETLIVGAGTYKAYQALDELIEFGVSNNNLKVHLGHTRLTGSGAKNPFYRYHPMLHSKIYYTENADGTACAIVGSHNVTGFALKGLNGEASIMIEGDVNDPEFLKIRNHIELAKNEAVPYQAGMKEAYTWWTNQFMEGLSQKTNDIPREIDKMKTILLFCQYNNAYPKLNDILYFELPGALGKIQSLKAEVHVFIFDNLPATPFDCLARINDAKKSFWATVEGVENNRGGRELSTDWFIDDYVRSILQKAPTPFRPIPRTDIQQIRVRLVNSVYNKYEYLFGKHTISWTPIFDMQRILQYDESYSVVVEKLDLIPPETKGWFLVKGLVADEGKNDKDPTAYEMALKALKPESGSYLLFSTGRREIKSKKRI